MASPVGRRRAALRGTLYEYAVRLPQRSVADRGSTVNDLLDFVFPDLVSQSEFCLRNPTDPLAQAFFSDRAVLTPTNTVVDKLNDMLLARFPEHALREYLSSDTLDSTTADDRAIWPLDLVHTLRPDGMPLHNLRLAAGCLIVVLRNLNIEGGLCNGTRCLVMACEEHVLDVMLLTGTHQGTRTFLPRVSHTSNPDSLPITLHRRQFPVRLAWAMTFNKAACGHF